MNEGMLYVVLLLFVICLFIYFFGSSESKKSISAWEEFARQLGLTPHIVKARLIGGFSTDSKVEGIYRNHSIILEAMTIGDSSDEAVFIVSRLSVSTSNPQDIFMSIDYKYFGIFNITSKKDIITGNYRFDKLFEIRGNNKQEVIRILDSDVQTKILSLDKPKKFNATINEKTVIFTKVGWGIIKDVDMLISVMDILIDIVEKLESR